MTTQQPLHGHVLGALVQGMLFCAIREGVEPVSLLQAAGLTLAEIEPLDVPIHHTKVLALYREIRLRRPDLELGLMLGMSLSPDRMAMLGHTITHAPTFGVALRDFMRFQKMLNGGVVTWSLTKSAGIASIHLTSQADLEDIPCVLEAPLAMVVMLARDTLPHVNECWAQLRKQYATNHDFSLEVLAKRQAQTQMDAVIETDLHEQIVDAGFRMAIPLVQLLAVKCWQMEK